MAKKRVSKARSKKKSGAAEPSREAEHIEVIGRGLIRQGSWILLCRNSKHGYFYLPGGHVEPGEGAGEAVSRELMEEAGLRAKAGECLAVAEVRFTQGGRRRHELNVVFAAEPLGTGHWAPGTGRGTGHWALGTGEDRGKKQKGGVFHVEHPLEGPPRPISSLEDGIEFEWVDAAAIVDVDLRPLVLKAWLVAGGTVGGGGGSVAWMAVSES